MDTTTRSDQPQAGATLGELVRFFFTKPSPVIITVAALTFAGVRVWAGRWSLWDLAIPAIIVALEPFTEWFLHVRLLHFKPRTIGRFTIDPPVARKHRHHHANPRDLRIVMVPFDALLTAPPVLAALAFWRLPVERASMALACGFVMLWIYEWTHYLIHAPYRPKTEAFRRRTRNHRLHHFKNEHYWYGVTTNFGDRVLGTNPAEADVGTSPTARTLGVDASA